MSLTNLVKAPTLSSSGDKQRYVANIQQMISNRNTSEDNRIFRQSQQANADRTFNSLQTQQGVTNAASQLAATRNDAYRTSVLNEQIAGREADEAWRNGGSADETARALAASEGLAASQRIERDEMVRQSLKDNFKFQGLSEGNIGVIEGSQEYQDARGSDHPSADATGLSEQQQLIRSTEAMFRGDLSSYGDPRAITKHIMEMASKNGWTQEQTTRALNQGLEGQGFSKMTAGEVTGLMDVEKTNLKAKTDLVKSYGGGSGSGSKSKDSNTVSTKDAINNAEYVENFRKRLDVGENTPIFGNTFDVNKRNLKENDFNTVLGALTSEAKVEEVFVLKALEYSGTVYDGVWDIPPEDLLKDKTRMAQLVTEAKKLKNGGDGSAKLSLRDAIDTTEAAQADSLARQKNNIAQGQYQQNSEAGRRASLQGLFTEQVQPELQGYDNISGRVDRGLRKSVSEVLSQQAADEAAKPPKSFLGDYAENSAFSGIFKPAYDAAASGVNFINDNRYDSANPSPGFMEQVRQSPAYNSVNQRPDFTDQVKQSPAYDKVFNNDLSMEEYVEDSIFSGAAKPVYDAVRQLVTKTESEIADIGSKKKQVSVVQKQIDNLPPMQQRTQAQKLHAVELGKLIMKINAQ
jgi:hypothetical protein